MSLFINLNDGDEVIVNGALLKARGKTTLEVVNHARILRGRDIMRIEDTNTPARRLYFACMMAYLDPDGLHKYQDAIVDLAQGLMSALEAPQAVADCAALAHQLALGDYYKALTICQRLVDYEAEALARIEAAA